MPRTLHAWLAVSAYLLLAAFPALWVGATSTGPAAWRTSALLAWLGLGLIALEFVLITRIHMATGPFGQDALLRQHRRAGVAGCVLLLLHPLLLLAELPPASLMPPQASIAINAGSAAWLLLLALVISTRWRKRLGLAYEPWLWLHRWLAIATLALGVFHADRLASGPMPAALLIWSALAALALLWYRGLRPAWQHRPWRVIENSPEPGRARRLVLRAPPAGGISYQAGQFCWLRLGSAWSWEAHPISLSSAPPAGRAQEIEFTIKDLGDWSGRIVPQLAAGTPVWIDGPYGVFTPERHPGAGYVLIGGGVGITPLVSMAAALAPRGVPVLLIHAARDAASLCLGKRIAALSAAHRNLRWVRVLESGAEAPDEAGWVNLELLTRQLPPEAWQWQFFVCGPEPMMDAVEAALTRLGMARSQVHTERFEMA